MLIIVLLPKRYQFKNDGNMRSLGLAVNPQYGWTDRFVRKGLEGRGAAAQAAEPPESPVFCGAKNAPI
jgi:hypothetical protein